MYCALLLTGIVVTSDKPFKFIASGISDEFIATVYLSYEDYNEGLPSFLNHFSFNRDKAIAFWQS